MIVNEASIEALFIGFRTAFNIGFEGVASRYKDIAMVVPSTTREEVYAWLGAMPTIREWIGPREIQNLSISNFTIVNKMFESTIAVDRNSIEDDRVGLFTPVVQQFGR